MDNQAVRIVPMSSDYLLPVVEIHLSSFKGFFLSFLGPEFLNLLYGEILNEVDAVALVAIDQDRVVGFVAGVTHQSSFYSRLMRRRLLSFARASLGAVISRPSILPRLFRALTYSRSSQGAIAQALLMSIAVMPDAGGRGIGKQLLRAFLNEMRIRGITSVSLTTDKDDNEHANHFYQGVGFELARSYVTREGRAMNEYWIRLNT